MTRLLAPLSLTLLVGCPADPPAAEPAAKPAAKPAPKSADEPAAKPEAKPAPSAFDAAMAALVGDYLAVSEALAADETEGVTAAAGRLADKAGKLDAGSVTGEHAAHYKGVPAKLTAAAKKLAEATDMNGMRAALKEVSKPMAMWAEMSRSDDVNVVFCSMAPGSWLQKGKEIRNPYYGAKMLSCGQFVSGPDKPPASAPAK